MALLILSLVLYTHHLLSQVTYTDSAAPESPPHPRNFFQPSTTASCTPAPILKYATPQERFAAVIRRHIGDRGTTSPPKPLNPKASLFTPTGAVTIPTGPAAPPAPASNPFSSAPKDRGGPGKGSGQGPRTPAHGASSMARLTYECQRRRCNPEIRITEDKDGRFKCDIVVQGAVFLGSKWFPCQQDAKLNTAARARASVSTWPLENYFPRPAAPAREGVSGRREKVDMSREEPAPGSGSGVDMGDPLQARAFVQGFRMGQMAAGRYDDGRDGAAQRRHRASSRSSEGRKRERRGWSSPARSRSRSPKRRRHRSRSWDRWPQEETYGRLVKTEDD